MNLFFLIRMAPPINSLLAYGSLLTAIKSGWELSRMLRRKLEDIRLSRLGANTRQSLSRALHSGCIDLFEYYKYQELIQFAENREDGI
jgi:hypothetical protein